MALIMDRYRDIYAFSSFFYTKLSLSEYEEVYKWARSIDLFIKRVLLFPVHHRNHWCLVSVNLTSCKLSLYDSLANQSKSQCLDAIEKYIISKEAEQRVSAKKWTKEISQTAPQQDNFNDCGVFVCMNASNLAEQSSIRFYLYISRTGKHIHNELLKYELLHFQV